MVGKTKRRKAEDQRRFDALKSMGCILCSEVGIPGKVAAEIHHITDCGRRIGHDHTIPLCPWHHRGQPWNYETRPSEMEGYCGPSLAKSKRAFINRFGTELQILSRVNQKLKEAV